MVPIINNLVIYLYFFILLSLRWYILGKHSNCIFTNNSNSECGNETNLLNEDECLTSQIIQTSEVISQPNDIILKLEEDTKLVPEESYDLLNQFEMAVSVQIQNKI